MSNGVLVDLLEVIQVPDRFNMFLLILTVFSKAAGKSQQNAAILAAVFLNEHKQVPLKMGICLLYNANTLYYIAVILHLYEQKRAAYCGPVVLSRFWLIHATAKETRH